MLKIVKKWPKSGLLSLVSRVPTAHTIKLLMSAATTCKILLPFKFHKKRIENSARYLLKETSKITNFRLSPVERMSARDMKLFFKVSQQNNIIKIKKYAQTLQIFFSKKKSCNKGGCSHAPRKIYGGVHTLRTFWISDFVLQDNTIFCQCYQNYLGHLWLKISFFR